jgi:hypothetical protein
VFAGLRMKSSSCLSLNVKQFTFDPLSHFSLYYFVTKIFISSYSILELQNSLLM